MGGRCDEWVVEGGGGGWRFEIGVLRGGRGVLAWVVEVEVWGDGVGLVVGWWWVDVCVGRGKGEKGRGQEEEESGEE